MYLSLFMYLTATECIWNKELKQWSPDRGSLSQGTLGLSMGRETTIFSGVRTRVTRSLVLCVCFIDRCLSFCTFSFDHCVFFPSSIYKFWLPLWYLQTLLVLGLLPEVNDLFWPLILIDKSWKYVTVYILFSVC